MTSPDHQPGIPKLPQELQEQLTAFQKNLWQIRIAEAVLSGFLGLFVSYLIVFGLDRLIETPGIVRLVILLAGVSLFAIFTPIWLHRWVWGHRQQSQLAKLISKKYPGLGDRLLGAIELSHQDGSAETLSPALRAAALRNVARESSARDLSKALPASKQRRLSFAAIGLFLAATGAIVFMPDAGMNALKRWLMPLSDTPRYTFAQIQGLPATLNVPYGETFPLDFSLSASSTRSPKQALARFDGKDWITTERTKEGDYHFDLPGQQAVTFLTVQVGDVIERVRIEPRLRPSLESLTAKITPPSYLQQSARELEIRTGYVSAVEGSTIELFGKASRELENLEVGPITYSGNSQEADQSRFSSDPNSNKPNSTAFTLPTFTLGKTSFEFPLQWTDIYQLGNKDPFRLSVEPVQDAFPATYAQGVPRIKVMLEEETLEFEVLAEDDWGLKEIGLEWSGQHTVPTDTPTAAGELILKKGSPTSRRLNHKVSFSPKAFEILPQKLFLKSFTTDYYPDRGRVYSQDIVIHILTRNQHAQLLQNQFERLLSALEDGARIEQENLDQNQRLDRNSPDALQKEENQQKLAEQEARESENTQKIQELSKRMEDLFKDALRNGEIDKESMKQLAETNETLRELAEKSLPKVREKLGDSQDKKNTKEKTKKDLEEAIEEQKKALEKMKEAIEKANKAKDRLEASTFVNRLKRAASDEDKIAQSMLDIGKKTVGLNTSIIDPAELRVLSEISKQQSVTTSDVRWIQEDLSSYFSRTGKPEHQELYNAMLASGIVRDLILIQRQASMNLLFRSIGPAKTWAEQLRAWAGNLEESMAAGGGGGGGGGGGSEADDDFEFMLRVMKMIQTEQDIRARTRSLEQLRRNITGEEPDNGPEPAPIAPATLTPATS